MEKKVYATTVRGDIQNQYILGRISAAMQVICTDDLTERTGYSHGSLVTVDDMDGETVVGWIFRVETTQDRYDRFLEVVRAWYPNFDFETME